MASTKLYSAFPTASATPGALALNSPGATAANASGFPVQQTLLTTAETVIGNPASPTTLALICPIPPGGVLEADPFDVVASGFLNIGTSSTVNIKLYSGTSLTPGSDTLLGASGAITAFAGKAPWYAKATLIYDSTSGKLQGSIKFMVNNTLVAEAAVSNVVTGLSSVNNPIANFVISFTFATAGTQVVSIQHFDVNH